MYTVLHAFLLWHPAFVGGMVRLVCDNSTVVDAINKLSIKGSSIRLHQTILLIAAVLDINLFSFWLPSEENIIADAASRHDYKKLANMGLQVSNQPRPKSLRQKLSYFFTNPLPTRPDGTTIKSANTTNRFAVSMTSLPQSSLELSMEPGTVKTVSTSKRHAVRHLPPSYDLECLRGILLRPDDITTLASPADTHSTNADTLKTRK
jgi:hypothetical protein